MVTASVFPNFLGNSPCDFRIKVSQRKNPLISYQVHFESLNSLANKEEGFHVKKIFVLLNTSRNLSSSL
uniref:Uncharacterized protein n=1 Tax=Megaselia scalaris TaxID=36166 RepID=T1GFL5_MEGSC